MAEAAAAVKYIFVVRHGQRKDHRPDVYPEFVGHLDTPLTPLGIDQADCVGREIMRRMQQICQDEKCTEYEVTMECSPFSRCLETSYAISKVVGAKTCNFNYAFAEWLAERLYNEDPVPKLPTLAQPADANFERLSSLFPGLTFADCPNNRRSLIEGRFPETPEQANERFLVGHQDLLESVKKQSAKLHFVVIVAHGFQQECIPLKYRNEWAKYPCYCAFTLMRMDASGKDEMILERYEDHMHADPRFAGQTDNPKKPVGAKVD